MIVGRVYDASVAAAITRPDVAALLRGEAVAVPWPPSGDVTQACADEVDPYAATAEKYSMTVEVVLDVISAFVAASPFAKEDKE